MAEFNKFGVKYSILQCHKLRFQDLQLSEYGRSSVLKNVYNVCII